MKYKRISNDPFFRHKIVHPYCHFDNVFTEEQLNEIENYCKAFDKQTASAEDITLRKSKIAWFHKHEHPKLHHFFNTLNLIIEQVNEDYFNYDLNGYSSIQYTTYDEEENGQYAYHMDMFTGSDLSDVILKHYEIRKLSMSLILSDSSSYEGGEFMMKLGDDEFEVEQKRGRIIFFSSFFLHKVQPVTKGIRKSIVTWVEGPKFI
jgi:PKHD-type hydroxylase